MGEHIDGLRVNPLPEHVATALLHVVANLEKAIVGFYGLPQLIYPFTVKAVDGQYHRRPAALAIISRGARGDIAP